VERNFSIRFVVGGLVLFTSAVLRPLAAQTSATSPMVNVLVMNYSVAPAEVLVKAQTEASRIFAQSGINFSWTYCPPNPSADSSWRCGAEPAPGEIRVRVVGHPPSNVFQDSVFGFAIAPTFATVYYDLAQTLIKAAGEVESFLPIVLGCLIAHEIGHLLLGENQHTVSGIMQARWDIRQIQLLTKGALQFTPQQGVRMRNNTQMRAKPPSVTELDSTEIAHVGLSTERR
jgi:hypothetical protein